MVRLLWSSTLAQASPCKGSFLNETLYRKRLCFVKLLLNCWVPIVAAVIGDSLCFSKMGITLIFFCGMFLKNQKTKHPNLAVCENSDANTTHWGRGDTLTPRFDYCWVSSVFFLHQFCILMWHFSVIMWVQKYGESSTEGEFTAETR